MINFNLALRDADMFLATIRIIAIDRGGSGIRSVRVFDRSRILLQEVNVDCAPFSEFIIEGIERGRLPLYLEGTECNETVTPPDRPYGFVPPGTDGAGIPVPCSPLFSHDGPSCRKEEARVIRARNIIAERCSEINSIRNDRDAYAAAVAALAILAAALYAAMAAVSGVPIFGQALGIVLLTAATIAIGIAIGLSIRVFREQLRLEAAEARLAAARAELTAAVDALSATCVCTNVDLTQPAC